MQPRLRFELPFSTAKVLEPRLPRTRQTSRVSKNNKPSMTESLADDAPTGVASPPKKKSLFSKAVKAKIAAPANPTAFFSRADELWEERQAEEEKRRQKRLQKLERKRSSTGAEARELTPPAEKKRRLSKDTREEYSSEGFSGDNGKRGPPETQG